MREVVRTTASGAVWTGTNGKGIGAPLAWSLIEKVPEGGYRNVHASCIDTGRLINGALSSLNEGLDVRTWGVRCARCGAPVWVGAAGMKQSTDVPSCRACRPAVLHVIKETT